MKIGERLLLSLMIVVVALLPTACGNWDSLVGGRTFSSSDPVVVQGVTMSDGTSFIVPPGTGTISDALSIALDKDKFLLKEGTYFDHVEIGRSLSIKGAGKKKSIVDGQYSGGSVFTIRDGAVVTLADMTIQNGEASCGGGIYVDHSRLTVKDCIIKDNVVMNYGGGIYVNGEGSSVKQFPANGEGGTDVTASLTLINSQVFRNRASYGAGIYNNAQSGAVKSILTVVNSQIFENTALVDGGGIYNDGRNNQDKTAILTLTNSQIFGNTAANGGGIYNDGREGGAAFATITNSQIFANKAIDTDLPQDSCIGGGGIYNNGQGGTAKMTLTNSQIFGNTGYLGGGIKNLDGTLNVYFCKITGNKAIRDGGGIYWQGTKPKIVGSLIIGNKPNNIAQAVSG